MIKKSIEVRLRELNWKDRNYNDDYEYLVSVGNGKLNGKYYSLKRRNKEFEGLLKVNLKSYPNYNKEFFKEDESYKESWSKKDIDRYSEIDDYLWVINEKRKELSEMRKFCLKELKVKDIIDEKVDEIFEYLYNIKEKEMEFDYLNRKYRDERNGIIGRYSK